MLEFLLLFLRCLFAGFQSHSGLVLENLALRHQLAVLKRQARKPKLRSADRLLWVGLRRIWPHWQQALLLFQPQTIIAWHRLGFRLFWRWKSRTRAGRPSVEGELIALIQRMWQANPTWGSRRIQAELAKLGIQVSDSTIRKYRPKNRRSPSPQTWKTFLQNHAQALIVVDFFAVPTATFRVLYVFLVLAHERRQVLHFQYHGSALGSLDGSANGRSFSLHNPAALSAPRSGCHLWCGFHASSPGPGLGTKAHCPSVSVTESHGRTSHRLDSP